MRCPNCKLENPPTAERCDCGYQFKPSSEGKKACPANKANGPSVLVKIFANIGMLVVGFAIAMFMDYGYIKTDAVRNPDGFFRKTQWMVLIFPLCVFGLNWRLFRNMPDMERLLACLLLVAVLVLGEIALLMTIGMMLHFVFGGGI